MNLDYMIGSRILYAISSDKLGVNKAATVNRAELPILLYSSPGPRSYFYGNGSLIF